MTDKKIMANQLSRKVGRAIYDTISKEGFDEPMAVVAEVTNPTCYYDDNGQAHDGRLICVRVTFAEDDDEDYDDDY